MSNYVLLECSENHLEKTRHLAMSLDFATSGVPDISSHFLSRFVILISLSSSVTTEKVRSQLIKLNLHGNNRCHLSELDVNVICFSSCHLKIYNSSTLSRRRPQPFYFVRLPVTLRFRNRKGKTVTLFITRYAVQIHLCRLSYNANYSSYD